MASIVQVLALSLLASAAVANRCPVVQIKDAEQCYGLTSECWSPGEPDIDCPNNGVCCFDGCVNVCDVPPITTTNPDPETPCTTEYVTQTEDVPEQMCTEIPGMETCTTINTSECEQECEWVDHPETVTESTTCCRNVKKLKCENLECDPNDGNEEIVPFEQTVCKKRERVCYNVPEQVCHDEEIQECKDIESQKCRTIKKPTEWPTTTQECVTKYREKCSIVNRQVCNGYHGHVSPKLHHPLFKKAEKFLGKKYVRQPASPLCYSSPEKVCEQEPYYDCKDVNTVTIEYEDVEECHPITETACVNKKVPKCRYVDKEQCNEAEDICETKNSNKTVFVPRNCDYVYKDCQFVDDEECEEKFHRPEKMVPKIVCEHVCSPVVKNDCKKDEPTQDCRTVFKTMSYKVPVLKC